MSKARPGEEAADLADHAAGALERLLRMIAEGEIEAPPGFIARAQGAAQALRVLADHQQTE
jgi:hypothetical protein